MRRIRRTYLNSPQLLCAIGDKDFQVAVSDDDGTCEDPQV